jgi:methyl-accepting chemotaxis protein
MNIPMDSRRGDRRPGTIRTRLVLYISTLIVLAVVLTTAPALYNFSESLTLVNSKNAQQGVDGLRNELENRKKEAMRDAGVIAMNPAVAKAVADKDYDGLALALAPFVKELGIDFVTVADDKGTVLIRTYDRAKGDSIAAQENVKSALGGKVLGTIETGTLVRLAARAGAPVRDEAGRVIGAVSAGYDLTKDSFVDKVKKMYGTDITIFLGDERVATTLIKDGKRVIGTRLNGDIAAIVLGEGQRYNARADILDMDYFTAYLPLFGNDDKPIGVLFAGESTAAVIVERNRLVATIAIVSLGVIGIGAVCAFFIAKGIANPLKTMLAAAQEVAAGNLAGGKIALTSGDEVGQLGAAFNTMTENLRHIVQQVSQATDQVAAAAEELTASAEQSAQATNQISASVSGVARGATEQAAVLDRTSAAVEQLSAGIQQVAANTDQIAAQSAQAADKANGGGKIVENAVEQMGRITDAVSTSARVMAELAESSQEIGQIADTISGIAGQTNLLALNAAIEAARAGEQGRGFAVVAEEVRKLAEQCQEAAKQIASLIAGVQRETDKAVIAMNDGTREVDAGVAVVNNAGQAFTEIVELVGAVSARIGEISADVQQMASGSKLIVMSVRDIDKISNNTAVQTQTVSAATEEQSASLEEIAASSQALAKMAETLTMTVSEFKI